MLMTALGQTETHVDVDEHDVWLASLEYYEEIYDAITTMRLDLALVAKARNTEMRFLVDELNAYKYDSVDNCLKTTGKRRRPVKWVDVNKGDAHRPEVRSRLAVAETMLRTTLWRTMRRHSRQHHRTKFCGCSYQRKIRVAKGVCGLLAINLRIEGRRHELRAAHAEKNMQAYVYVDNFVIKGVRRELYDFFEHLKVHMWAKSEGVLRPDLGQVDVREVLCLNRLFRWCLPTSGRAEAIEIEADARYVEILVHQLNLWPALPLEKHTPFRSMFMRANYLAEDGLT